MTKLPLNVVGTHWEFHNDELVMIALLAWYGHKKFLPPSTGSLLVQFHRSTEAANAALATGGVQLLVGIGGGDWDEHKKEGRLADECGATVAADQLGVRGNPELKLILDYALRADREAGQKYFELAEILKTLHGWSDMSQMRILHLGMACLRAVRNRESGAPSANSDRPIDLQMIAADWLLSKYGRGYDSSIVSNDPQAVAKEIGVAKERTLKLVLGELKRWAEKPDEVLPFELPKLVEVLNSHGGRSAADITAMVEAILDARVRRSYDFMVKCPQEVCDGKTKVLEIGGLKVGFAESDSRSMGSYLRTQDKCDLIVLQKSTGNVNIFSGDGGKALMPKVARNILITESNRRGVVKRSDELLVRTNDFDQLVASNKGRDLLGVPWYYHLEAGALHNGTSTHPDVEPSKLTIRDIAEAIIAARQMAELERILDSQQTSSRPDRTGGG